jgi:hypothetical protein
MRTGGGESTGAVIYICIGTTQGNSLCSYLYLKQAKHCISCLVIYVFSSIKLEKRRAEWFWGERGWHQWNGGDDRERGRRINMVQTMYTHVCKCKNYTC